ncbi:hypothetical protein Pelo_3125 [Pelomyxa schiedti]|nr:hypothetical protein Pelo_3125 [Pelomyxa schiedti]
MSEGRRGVPEVRQREQADLLGGIIQSMSRVPQATPPCPRACQPAVSREVDPDASCYDPEVKARIEFKQYVETSIKKFLDSSEDHFEFEPVEDRMYRLIIHQAADENDCVSHSFGLDPNRVTIVWRATHPPDDQTLQQLQQKYNPESTSAQTQCLQGNDRVSSTTASSTCPSNQVSVIPDPPKRRRKEVPPQQLELLSLNQRKRETLTIEDIQEKRKRSRTDSSMLTQRLAAAKTVSPPSSPPRIPPRTVQLISATQSSSKTSKLIPPLSSTPKRSAPCTPTQAPPPKNKTSPPTPTTTTTTNTSQQSTCTGNTQQQGSNTTTTHPQTATDNKSN